ncbi:hypothetical protein [Bacillus thuringiensis]|uniref:hypothetical protein n=1 Tax=Bacillus thuringiensis TaxID=1428 RepID=UPI0015C514DF|nr:hypothetical protein [Bacillus thuringiensis]
MRDSLGKLFYRLFDALGTLSVFFIVTEGFNWKYVTTLLVSAVLAVLLPYEVRRKEDK